MSPGTSSIHREVDLIEAQANSLLERSTLPKEALRERLQSTLPIAADRKFRAFYRDCLKATKDFRGVGPDRFYEAMRLFHDSSGRLSMVKLSAVGDDWDFTARTRRLALKAFDAVTKHSTYIDAWPGLHVILNAVERGETVSIAPAYERVVAYTINPKKLADLENEFQQLSNDADRISSLDPRRLVVRGFAAVYGWARLSVSPLRNCADHQFVYWLEQDDAPAKAIVGPNYIFLNDSGKRDRYGRSVMELSFLPSPSILRPSADVRPATLALPPPLLTKR